MEYRVEFSSRARKELEDVFEWVEARAPIHGPRWFARFEREIDSLKTFPERCPVASDVLVVV